MWLVAGVYFKVWQCVSDSCSVCKLSDHSSPAVIVAYLHVEARPLRCKTVLRHRGGWKLVGLDLMGLHPQGRTLCHVRRRTTEKIKWYVNFISKAYAVFSSFEQALTYSLALWRHVVCSWPSPLPPSASVLSLAEVRKTVLMPDKLRSLGWIFSLFLFAQKWSRNSSLFCTFYMPKTPKRTWRAGVRWKNNNPDVLISLPVQVCSDQTQIILTQRAYYWRRLLTPIYHYRYSCANTLICVILWHTVVNYW